MTSRTTRRPLQTGISLIEILVVVTIVGILAAVAVPSYDNYQRRSHRQIGAACLMSVQSLMESYYQRKNAYPSSLSSLGLASTSNCPDSPYTITLSADAVGSCEQPMCYELRASAPGTQVKDGTLVLQVRYTNNTNNRYTKQRILPGGAVKPSWTD